MAEIILKVVPKYKKVFLKYKIHPATRIFQAIRIFINNELQNIELGLNNSIDVLNSGGRIIAVSYHSLEDRIVKNIFKNRTDCKVITKKPITPSKEEISYNRSSRSAKLQQQKNLKNKKFSFLILFLFVLIVYFYLRQQISIINLQNKIKQMYDEIRILENENKEISLKIQDFLQEENLQKLAEKLGFEPISEKDIVEYKDE